MLCAPKNTGDHDKFNASCIRNNKTAGVFSRRFPPDSKINRESAINAYKTGHTTPNAAAGGVHAGRISVSYHVKSVIMDAMILYETRAKKVVKRL